MSPPQTWNGAGAARPDAVIPRKTSRYQAPDPVDQSSRPLRTATAVAYPPCRGRRLYLLVALCPDCLEYHQHRVRDLPTAGGLVRRAPCDRGEYLLLPREAVVEIERRR